MSELPVDIRRLIILAAVVISMTSCGGRNNSADQVGSSGYIAPAEVLKAQSGDLSLYVRKAGGLEPADTLIASNGGPGQSSHYMLDLEQLAGPELAVVTYDQRGTGRSDSPPPSSDNFELADYVADLEAVRQSIGVEKVHLLGHSWGALVTAGYAIAYPENVASLTLMGGAAPEWVETRAGMSRFQRHLAELQRAGIIPSTLPADGGEQFEAILPAYLSDPAATLEGWVPSQYDEMTNRLTWSTIQSYDLTEALGALTMPVLVLWGEDDPFGKAMAENTRDALTAADVDYVLLQGCGHYWHECPGEFYPVLIEFLER
ncbi:MAG: alpha/beta fold hydrolase [Chloroflexota bacterium]|nr:MAG: alpha/beta fold hydrolase [Chloroflexota bacterium]